ncbi:MAG: hypothetical protein JST80_11305 [Bdellovibrionales bacterium]|nr:hypothetical protein [Bdellovibrionales bacterium]
MKSLFIVLTAMASLSASAEAGKAKKIYSCETNADPDSLSIDIYSSFGKLYAELGEQSCDGDCGAEDLVELRRYDDGNDAFLTLVQVTNPKASFPGTYVKKPSHKTRGIAIRIDRFVSSKSAVKGVNDPFGEKLPTTGIGCKAVINAI